MRAWTFTARGSPSAVLRLRDDLPKPTADMLAPDDVLVKISHISVFQGFAMLMTIIPHPNNNPWIPGSDFAGVIEATGSDVQHLKSGDPVFGSPNPKAYLQRGTKYNGALAEYVIVPAGQVVRKPENVSFEESCGLAGNGCTALQFCEKAGVKKGHRVLVIGVSGGLGSVTAQVAKAVVGSEGRIVGVCSAANADLVKGIGVDEVVDYKSHPQLSKYLSEQYSSAPFDIIIDCVGADDSLYFDCPQYLAPDGVFIGGGKMDATHGGGGILNILVFGLTSVLRMHWPVWFGGVPRRYVFISGDIVPGSLKGLPALVEAGKLRGLVDSEFDMENALKAFERVATRRARGKVVVRVQDV